MIRELSTSFWATKFVAIGNGSRVIERTGAPFFLYTIQRSDAWDPGDPNDHPNFFRPKMNE